MSSPRRDHGAIDVSASSQNLFHGGQAHEEAVFQQTPMLLLLSFHGATEHGCTCTAQP